MISDAMDVTNILADAIRIATSSEAVAKNVVELNTVPVMYQIIVETVEGKTFNVFVVPGGIPLIPKQVVNKEGAGEHVANAMQGLKGIDIGKLSAVVGAAITGAIRRLEQALIDLGRTE